MSFLVALLLWVGTSILSWAYNRFIAKKPQLGQEPWQVPTVATGTPIPVLLGTQRVRPIPVNYIGEELHDIIAGGSFLTGSQIIGQNHYVTYQGLVCWGRLDAYQNLIANDAVLASRLQNSRREAIGVTVDGKVIYATKLAVSTDHDANGAGVLIFGKGKIKFSIYLPDIYQKYDGIGGDFTLYFGTGQTGPDPTLEAWQGAGNVPDYRELVYVVFNRFRMGMDPSRPIDLVLTKGTGIAGFPGLGPARILDGPGTVSHDIGGAAQWAVQDVTVPAALYALMVDPRWALGVDPAEIDLAQWIAIHQQTSGNLGDNSSETTGVSALITSQAQASAFRDEFLHVLNAALVRHPETNLYQIKLIRNETPNQAAIDALRTFGEADIRSIKVTQRTWAETYNEVVVEFTNPELLFQADTVVARDDASIASTGRRSLKLSFLSVTDPTLAARIAIRELRAASPVLEKQSIEMTRTGFDLERGDVFKVNFSPVGYTNRILRCLSVDWGTPSASRVVVEAVDDVFAHEELPVTVETRQPNPPTPTPVIEPTFSFKVDYSSDTATVTVIVVDPDSRLQSIRYATSVGSLDVIVADGYADLALVEPYAITVARDPVEQTWLHLSAVYLDRYGNAATWTTTVDIYPTNTPLVTPTALDGSTNPIVWDTEGKAWDAKSVIIPASRSLLIENAVPGFHGELTVTSTGGTGYVLTLPAGSIIGDGSSLNVTLSAKDKFSVYYDGTYFWWNHTASATAPPIPLAAALSASASLSASLGKFTAAMVSDVSLTADLTTHPAAHLEASLSAAATVTAALTTGVGGLAGQWQSDVGVTTSGSTVTAIADQSGHGNDLTPVGTGPTLVSSVLNGLPGIRHAVNTALRKTSASGLTGADMTIVVVHSPYNSTTAGQMVMYDVNNGLAAVDIGNGTNGDYRIGGPYNSIWPTTNAVWRGNSVVNTFDIVMVVRESGVLTFYKNGVALTPTNTRGDGVSSAAKITVGGDAVGNTGSGTWTQLRVYNHALNATDRASVFSDLATYYGLSILSSSGTALSRAGWTATAYADGGGGFVPASAIDSNIGTRYLSAAGVTAGSSWFKIDMGSAQTVGGVQVDNNPANGGGWSLPTAGDVQYSDDNSTWHTVASWSLGTVPTTIQASWTPSSHRYWRLLAQGGSADGGWWSIGELYFYSDAAP